MQRITQRIVKFCCSFMIIILWALILYSIISSRSRRSFLPFFLSLSAPLSYLPKLLLYLFHLISSSATFPTTVFRLYPEIFFLFHFVLSFSFHFQISQLTSLSNSNFLSRLQQSMLHGSMLTVESHQSSAASNILSCCFCSLTSTVYRPQLARQSFPGLRMVLVLVSSALCPITGNEPRHYFSLPVVNLDFNSLKLKVF